MDIHKPPARRHDDNDDSTIFRVMLIWCWSTLAGVILLYLALLLFAEAHASQLNRNECYTMSIDVFNIATLRDEGIPEHKTHQMLRSNALSLVGQPDAYLKTRADVDLLLELLHRIYGSTLDPSAWAIKAYQACVALGFGDKFRQL